jgi:putative DNA modification/repair radical SAM protein
VIGDIDSAVNGTYNEHMAQLDLTAKLEILADAAKYDASCASSGGQKRSSRDGSNGAKGKGGIGSVTGSGICHAYAPDGRCISLLKLLLTNSCIFDCHYCINRRSSNVRRARFTPQEVVTLTLDFYRRNYIEGLFLSSGIIRNSDYTMEQLVRVARSLREDHGFRGYIHLKTIPDADPELIRQAGMYADRVSINVELPTQAGLDRLAPEKDAARIDGAMAGMKAAIEDGRDAAGQSTQMIVGADGADDVTILDRSSALYGTHRLKRVYYSAFSPIPDASAVLPLKAPPLVREHRLYQSDWMLRFYGFSIEDLRTVTAAGGGMLPLDIDPKLAWALAQREAFPVDVNRAPKEALLRVPGLGPKSVSAILKARRHRRLRLEDVQRLTRSVTKLRPFLVTADWTPGALLDAADLPGLLRPKAEQMELFAA